jgi:hypothetical protein
MRGLAIVPTQRNKVLGALVAVILTVALVDSILSGNWDLVVVLGLALAVQLTLIFSMYAPRPAVPLRGDLVRWLDERSAATGEPLEHIADRCIAAYRAGLSPEPTDEGRPS